MAGEQNIPSGAPDAAATPSADPVSKEAAAPVQSDPHIILRELEKDMGAAPSAEPLNVPPAAVTTGTPAEELLTEAMRRLDQILRDIKDGSPGQT